MNKLYSQRTISANNLFEDNLINPRDLYMHCFNVLPSINKISSIDGEKSFSVLKAAFSSMIRQVYVYQWFKPKEKKYNFDNSVILFKNGVIADLTDNYCEILHDGSNLNFVHQVTQAVSMHRQKQRRQPREINMISSNKRGLELKRLEIKKINLDLDLFYEDDFKETDELIRKRLNSKNDKGIVLLHGLPGTGKTTYLRYLIGKIKKRVLFLPPSVAENMVNPEFVDLLVNYPNSVLIIEDAESIITDRRLTASGGVSSLLNISDGLLADSLNVQVICTFNSQLTTIDSALLRKGRLIAKYEFGKLSVEKAQRLSDHLRFKHTITKPMTIAEIANQHEKEEKSGRVEVVGFRRPETIMN